MSGPAPRWKGVAGTAATRLSVTIASAAIGVLVSHIVISEWGVGAYATYGLLVSLVALLPFADLGLSAVLINQVSAREANAEARAVFVATLTSVLRLLVIAALVLALLVLVLGWAGLWPLALGGAVASDDNALVTICLLLFALALPLGSGASMLIGSHRAALQNLVQITGPLVTLCGCLWLSSVDGSEGSAAALLTYAGNALASLICLLLAAWFLRPDVFRAMRLVTRLRAAPQLKVSTTAVPMVIQLVAVPVAMQSGRVVLSHNGTSEDLAIYNLGTQLFGVVLQVLGATGMALWAHYGADRSTGRVASPLPTAIIFGIACAIAGIGIAVVQAPVVKLIAGREFELPGEFVAVYVTFLVVQGAKVPLGMYMTDPAGLRFQVVPSVLLVVVTLTLSITLAGPLGATGVVIASLVGVTFCQLVPYLWYTRHDVIRRRLDI